MSKKYDAPSIMRGMTQKNIGLSNRGISLADKIKDIILEYPNSNEAELESFLIDNPRIIDYIPKAKEQIRKYFGNDVEISLEVFFDPEVDDDDGTSLFMNVRTSDDLDSAMQKLDSLDEEWFIPEVGEYADNFTIDLD